MDTVGSRKQKLFSRNKKPFVQVQDLLEPQRDSYEKFLNEGLWEVFQEYSPINDYNKEKFSLSFVSYKFDKPKYTEEEAKRNMHTYGAALKVQILLKNKTTKTSKKQEILFGNIPLMTKRGTFILNGIERIIVSQLSRSFGVFFSSREVRNERYFTAKIVPEKGSWIVFESEPNGTCFIKIDKISKIPLTSLLRVFGYKTDKDIMNAAPNEDVRKVLKKTMDIDPAKTHKDAVIEVYKKIRYNDQAVFDSALIYLNNMFSEERYSISELGRYKFNERFGIKNTKSALSKLRITKEDLIIILAEIVKRNNDPMSTSDDIDHLSRRRVRYVGEIIQNRVRKGLARLARNMQDRMTTVDRHQDIPIQFINVHPFQSVIRDFFLTDQLSQLVRQHNILDELEHRRTLTTLGPGGLTKDHAGIEVRDLHPSHYGRICPVHTPEGPTVGLILHLSIYARVNKYGLIETPYVKVDKGKITKEVVYMDAAQEEEYKIAHKAVNIDDNLNIMDEIVIVRYGGIPIPVNKDQVDFIDISNNQILSVSAALIPFIEHNAPHRSTLGSITQRQAIPCVLPDAPLVATGNEKKVAKSTGHLVIADEDGVIEKADAEHIILKTNKGERIRYDLIKYGTNNHFSVHNQRTIVSPGRSIKKGDVLADAALTDHGQIALGQNLRAAFLCLKGHNYEDAIVLSRKVVEQDKFTSIHTKTFDIKVRETKLGAESTTYDIPNVSENKLRNLDERGIVRLGAYVSPGDFLVGKITPKGEKQLTPEERMLRSIFGDKAKEVKDTSEKISFGHSGRVIDVRVFSRENGDQMEPGVIESIYITVAQLRNIKPGDKLIGRHGNKGVISKILAPEDMPFTADGDPVDIVLSPLGVPSRTNLGQVFEMHLGGAASKLGYQAVSPAFLSVTEKEIESELHSAGLSKTGKEKVYDGQTGELLAQDVAVGNMYILKLEHMVDEKIHMRSIGPYSLVSQQPLPGRARFGGQRMGEMEIWALLGYGAAYNLKEMITIKSDDVRGRSSAFNSMVKGERIKNFNPPAAFNVLVHYLKGLGLSLSFQNDKQSENKEE